VEVTIAKKEIKINRGTVYSALKSKIKENKMYKDYNALIGSIKVEIRGIFFY
jgi:hypothetical protein